jgi:hypothetical protein
MQVEEHMPPFSEFYAVMVASFSDNQREFQQQRQYLDQLLAVTRQLRHESAKTRLASKGARIYRSLFPGWQHTGV